MIPGEIPGGTTRRMSWDFFEKFINKWLLIFARDLNRSLFRCFAKYSYEHFFRNMSKDRSRNTFLKSKKNPTIVFINSFFLSFTQYTFLGIMGVSKKILLRISFESFFFWKFIRKFLYSFGEYFNFSPSCSFFWRFLRNSPGIFLEIPLRILPVVVSGI